MAALPVYNLQRQLNENHVNFHFFIMSIMRRLLEHQHQRNQANNRNKKKKKKMQSIRDCLLMAKKNQTNKKVPVESNIIVRNTSIETLHLCCLS